MARNRLAHKEPYLWDGRYLIFNGKFVHITVWEEHNGRVPAGLLVHHKNEDKLDNRIDNLELITRAGHCKFHNPRLGYRAPTLVFCIVCNFPRPLSERLKDPHRNKCNQCRGKEYRDKRGAI